VLKPAHTVTISVLDGREQRVEGALDASGKLGGFAFVDENDDSEVTIVARSAAIAHGQVVDGADVPWDRARVAIQPFDLGDVVLHPR
jgi:hypothetical protein